MEIRVSFAAQCVFYSLDDGAGPLQTTCAYFMACSLAAAWGQ